MDDLKKINVFYSIRNAGDGSAYLRWFLTSAEASKDQENQDEGFAEDCSGMVQTYEGSNIHKDAIEQQGRDW
jgi:hypothetical protein